MQLGDFNTDTKPTVTSGVLDLVTNSGARASVVFPAATTANFTSVAVVKKNATSTGGLQALFSKIGAFAEFSVLLEAGNSNPGGIGLQFNGTNVASQKTHLMMFPDAAYHMVGTRYDGTTVDFFFDDMLWFSVAATPTAIQLGLMWVGAVNGGFQISYLINSQAIWRRALTDAEMRRTFTALQTNAALSSITVTPPTRVYMAEGDSITQEGSTGVITYPYKYVANASTYGTWCSLGYQWQHTYQSERPALRSSTA